VLLDILLAAYAAVLGLIVGSYLNVVIHRLPRGISTVLPRSRCPACGAAIRARDNLPLLSFVLLGGRCRDCGAPIPWRYPVIEALTAVLFVGCILRFGPNRHALAAALFCSLLVALGTIDAEHLLLPDRITLPGIVAGVALQPWIGWAGWRGALLGAALGGGVLLALYGLWYLLRREEGLGLGDVKMLAMVGAFLGWRGVVVTLFFGSLAGALAGLALIRSGRGHRKSKLPLGTFLAGGGIVALFAGERLVDAYLGLL
jgi:leader peptidase (prepilin peptidase)/N-methyltransferase